MNPSSFDAYEGLRILLPGAIVVSLYAAVVATYNLSLPTPQANAAAAVVAALLVGLVLLFIDVPKQSAAYKGDDLPDRELRRWNVDPSGYGGFPNLYFVMLDVSFPATIRNRALYMGAMYRAGFEGIYLVGLTSLAVLTTTAASPALGLNRHPSDTSRIILFAAAGVHCLMFLEALRGRYVFRRGRFSSEEALKLIRRELSSDLGVAGVVALLVSAYAYPVFVDTRRAAPLIVAIAAPAVVWAFLYALGRPDVRRTGLRSPLSPATAALLYGAAAALASAAAAVSATDGSPLGTAPAALWGALSLLPSLLMSTRGHEKKLIGSFRTQTTWMRVNKRELIREYKLYVDPHRTHR